MTPQEVEHYVLLASDASNLQQQQQANSILHHWVASSDDNTLVSSFLQIVRSTQQEIVIFYALTTFLRLQNSTTEQRAALRQEILNQVVTHANNLSSTCWNPTYLRTKVGVMLARFIQQDFPHAWPNAFNDLQDARLLNSAPDIFLRTLAVLMDDFGRSEDECNTNIKDILRGTTNEQAPSPHQTMSGKLLETLVSLLALSLEGSGTSNEQNQMCILSLTVLKGFNSWLDLSLIVDEKVFGLIFAALARGSVKDSPVDDAGVAAMECLQELIARGMDDDKKIAMLSHTGALSQIHNHVNLEEVDASPIDVVLEVAKFINITGLEVIPVISRKENPNDIMSQLLDLFFRCFAYDDIDVSGAVIPLAAALVGLQGQEQDAILSQLLSITYRQMRYPDDFQYDYEDEDEAEEEVYRTELRKLHHKVIRAAPEKCLQFTCQVLSQLPVPLSSSPTPDIEAALRLVYHYCEGIRPPPGMKVVMRNDTFVNLLVALHKSDITYHSHREVLTIYYETAVRYHPLLKQRSDLLQVVLESLTGNRGLQHGHSRVRSRCCYLLLRLIKSLGGGGANSVLRPYLETAVSGIQALLNNNSAELRPDDTLYLFETIGLLLGKTGLDPAVQQQYLAQVMTPHVRSIQQILEQKQAVAQDTDHYGGILSGSIAAIAFLSKGFKDPPLEVQSVLLETLSIAYAVLEALPGNGQVRNKSFVLLQRMIQCLETKVLPSIPRFLFLVIEHCTTEDILDVAQLFNQLCIKYKGDAVSAIDGSLLSFLRKCHALIIPISKEEQNSSIDVVAPHLRIEQLSVQKLTFTVLQHIVTHGVTAVLLSPTNASSLENILQSMSEGAIHVEDPLMKKTCLGFFRELVDQWIGGGASNVNVDIMNNGRSSDRQQVVHGFLMFVCDILIPGVLQSFLDDTFNEQDANQWRSVTEMAHILHLLKERAPEAYQHAVLSRLGNGNLLCPAALLGGFRNASDPKEMELCIKQLITTRKTNNKP